jgi:hypothetical protein
VVSELNGQATFMVEFLLIAGFSCNLKELTAMVDLLGIHANECTVEYHFQKI